MSSLSISQGDVLVSEIPFTDFSGSKRRPVVVISNSQYNTNSGNVIVLSISSTQPGSKYDSALLPNDLEEGELKRESKILADFPITLSKRVVLGRVGRITNKKLLEIKEKIRELYEL